MKSVLLGYDSDGLPIFLIEGAEDDDPNPNPDDSNPDDEPEADDDTDDDADTDDDEKPRPQPKSGKRAQSKTADYKPPSRAEWERTKAALKKANDDQRAARKAALEKAKKEGMDEAATNARTRALEEADAKWMPRVVTTEAKAELLAMGCKNPARLVKLVDSSKISMNDSGELLGLEEQLNELKTEWPELFADATSNSNTPPKKNVPPAKKVGAAAGASKKDEPEEKKPTPSERLAAALAGGMARD